MDPITLFDKSFLQSLTENESVWFGHFHSPLVCPLFYVETLADLDKDVGNDRTPEREVRKIARKFPENGAYPCTYHATLATAELLGNPIPMDGRIPRFGGRLVEKDGRTGIVYEQSPEEEAFGRWLEERFVEVERHFAKVWRASLGAIRLEDHAGPLRALGIDAKGCQSLAAARDLARSVVTGRDSHFRRIELAIGIPQPASSVSPADHGALGVQRLSAALRVCAVRRPRRCHRTILPVRPGSTSHQHTACVQPGRHRLSPLRADYCPVKRIECADKLRDLFG